MPSTRRQVLTAIGAAGVTSLAGCTASLEESPYSPGTNDSTEWPMPAYDKESTAFNPDAAVPRDDVAVRWETDIPVRPIGRPVVAADTVFLPTWEALLALDLASGKERWRVSRSELEASAPVVHEGTVYIGIEPQGLLALDAATGHQQWRVDTRGDVWAAPTFGNNNEYLYVGDSTGRIYQVALASGEVTLTGEVFGSVRTLTHYNFPHSLLVGTASGEVYRLDPSPEEGVFVGAWRRMVAGGVTSIVARSSSPAIVVAAGRRVYGLKSGSKTSRWEVEDGSRYLASPPYDVVGTDGGGLQVLDTLTGNTQWAQSGRFDCAPAVAGDRLLVGGSEQGPSGRGFENRTGFVTAYELQGGLMSDVLGRSQWTFETESPVMEGVTVADGAVFTATGTAPGSDKPAKVYALERA